MDTLTLQKTLNTMLVPAGYIKLDEDGALGAKTCGACKMYMPSIVPAECASKGYTTPTKVGAAPTTTTAYVSTAKTPAVTTSSFTSSTFVSSTKWIIGASIAVGLGLVAFAFAKKREWL